MKKSIVFPLFSALLLFSVNATSQAQDSLLRRRSGIELNIGIWTGGASTSIDASGIQTEAKAGAFIGGILFAYWLQEYLSVTFSAGLVAGEVSSTVSIGAIDQHVSTVAPLLIGVRWYVPHPEPDIQVRPFLSAAVGTYVGSETKNALLSQETHTEMSFGGRLGGGMDFMLSNHFKLGVNVGYNIMSDFNTDVGGRKNYNGAEFSFGIGYIF